MTSNLKNTGVLSYAARGSSHVKKINSVRFLGMLAIGKIKPEGLTKKRINHDLSNLIGHSVEISVFDLQQVIRLAQSGDFGSTEVPPNQIW